jgi:hypothetical protein
MGHGMRETRGNGDGAVDTAGNRRKLLGAAIVAFGLAALGVYSFASGDSRTNKTVAHQTQPISGQIETTPERSHLMPVPVEPTPKS